MTSDHEPRHPVQVGLGLVVLVTERLRGIPGVPRTVAVAVGAAAYATDGARRVIGLASRAGQQVGRLPGTSLVRRAADAAAVRGARIVAAGRTEALDVVQNAADDTVTWAQADAVPRIIDSSLPDIRTRVVPAVIGDVTVDPRVRDLVLVQGRGVLGDAAANLRAGAASADDRVESTVRRVFRRGRDADG